MITFISKAILLESMVLFLNCLIAFFNNLIESLRDENIIVTLLVSVKDFFFWMKYEFPRQLTVVTFLNNIALKYHIILLYNIVYTVQYVPILYNQLY